MSLQLDVTTHFTVTSSVPASYTGPGDIVASAVAFWGLRAYTSASIGGNCVDIVRASDSSTQTFTTVSGGLVDKASIATFLTATTGQITKIYDQTGNGNDLTPNNASRLPAYTANVLGTNPAMQMATTNGGWPQMNSPLLTQAQALTVSIVCNRTQLDSSNGVVFQNDATGLFIQAATANLWRINAGTTLGTFTANDNTTHSFNCVFNGASSDLNIDGSANTGAAGATGFSNQRVNLVSAGFPWTGNIFECGFWPSAFSGTQSSNMSSNQHAFWGF